MRPGTHAPGTPRLQKALQYFCTFEQENPT
jgi:hypothetical protein